MTESELMDAIRRLFADGRAATVEWERTAFDQALAATGPNVVLFGAGGLGRRALAGLRTLGIEPLAFADNNAAIWGQTVNGVPAMSVPEAAARYGKSALFIHTIWHHLNCRLADQRRQLAENGVQHIVSFIPLYWKLAGEFLPHYAIDFPHKMFDAHDRILQAATLWADDRSRVEYFAQLRWRLKLDHEALPPPVAGESYFPPDLVRVHAEEVFVDCGAFDGDTIEAFFRHSDYRIRQVVAAEPDPMNREKLMKRIAGWPIEVRAKVAVHPVAVGAAPGSVTFTVTGSPASGIGVATTPGERVTVDCVRLDDLLAATPPTFMKLDIEGAEVDALRGAEATIRAHRPILAICLYHQQDHLWTIPQMLREFVPDYRLSIRPHEYAGWDLVCYAVPPERELPRRT